MNKMLNTYYSGLRSLPKKKTLHPKSKEFIVWALNKLKDTPELLDEVVESVDTFYNQYYGNKLEAKLKSKLIKGGKEYGAPIYSLKRIDKEIEQEMIDLLGWTLVRIYNFNRLKIKNLHASRPRK